MRWDYQDLRVGFVLTWYSGVSMRRMLRGVANIITDLEALKGAGCISCCKLCTQSIFAVLVRNVSMGANSTVPGILLYAAAGHSMSVWDWMRPPDPRRGPRPG